jgi:hypothetical protein
MIRDKLKVSIKEIDEAAELSERYFHTKTDKTQMASTEKNYLWIHKKFPFALDEIEDSAEVIGYTILLPCRKKLMLKFLLKKMNEKELVEHIRENPAPKSFEAIYFCEAYLKPHYRHKGLASKAAFKSTRLFVKSSLNKPKFLFYWAYSKNSKALAERIGEKFGLIVLERK